MSLISGYEKGVNSTFLKYKYIVGHKLWYCRSLTNILKRNIISMLSVSANLQYLQSQYTNTLLFGLSFFTWCHIRKRLFLYQNFVQCVLLFLVTKITLRTFMAFCNMQTPKNPTNSSISQSFHHRIQWSPT